MMKKVFSLLLAVALVFGTGITALASSSSDKITDVVKPIDANVTISDSSIKPGATLKLPLTADMFAWSSGTARGSEALTIAQIKGITVDSRNINDKIMKAPTISLQTVGGMKTACVVIEFVDEWFSVDTVDYDFTIYLRLNKNRKTNSEVNISGSFGHAVKEIDSNDDFVAMDEFTVIKPTEYIKDIELDLGGGLSMITKLFASRKYYGYAVDDITGADDSVVLKYNSIVGIYRIYSVNLDKTSKNIKISGYDDCYVYGKDGKYLGATSESLPYSDIMYISDKQIDMGGGLPSTSNSSSSSSSSSSSTPASSRTSSSSVPAASTPSNTTVITTDDLTKLTQTAISTAKSSGSGTAAVRVKDAKSVSADALKAMTRLASSSGLSSQLNADIMNGASVSGRLTINPALASGLSGNINLGVYTDAGSVGTVRSKFSKWYTNNLQVISLAQKGNYGMTVTVSAKVDLSGIDSGKMRLYSYDTITNKFKELTSTGVRVDSSGYLQFKTTVGNEIIVSNGPLTRS